MKFFLKELVSRPIKLPSGHGVEFEDVGGDMGVIATDNGYLMEQLSLAAERKVGGVVEISQEQFEDLKKNALPGNRSAPRLRHVVEALLRAQDQAAQAQPSPAPGAANAGSAAAGSKPAEPIKQGAPMEVPLTIPSPTPASQVKKVDDDDFVATAKRERAENKAKSAARESLFEKMKDEAKAKQ